MGFEGHGRGRGGFRGSHRGGGERGKSVGFMKRGGSPGGGGSRGRGGGSGGRDFSSSGDRGKGGNWDRDSTVNKHGGFKSNGRGGGNRASFSPRGGKGDWSPRGGRGGFTPRGREFRGSGRGGRGSFSDKRVAVHHDNNESSNDVRKIKKSFSATTTPINTKKQNMGFEKKNKRQIDDEDEDNVPVSGKKATNGKTIEADHEEETDSEDQDEEFEDEDVEMDDEDEESDDDESSPNAAKKMVAPRQKQAVSLKKNVVEDSDSEEEEEEDDDDEDEAMSDEEEDAKIRQMTKKALPKKDSVKGSNLKTSTSDDDDDEDDENEEDDEEDDEESEEDEEQVEPLMKTPVPKSSEKVMKSALKSGKGIDVKKSVNVSGAATSASPAKKLPVTPYPQKKTLSAVETPKTKLNFDDDSSDEEDEELDEAVEDEEDDDEEEDIDEDEEEGGDDSDENEDEDEEEDTSKKLEAKIGSMKKQAINKEHPAQGIKKKVAASDLSAIVNKGQLSQGIKKTAIENRTLLNKGQPDHDDKKKNILADRATVLKNGHPSQDIKKKVKADIHAVIASKQQGSGIKRKAVVEEHAAVSSSEHPGQTIKKKAIVDDRTAVTSNDHRDKSIKKKAHVDGHGKDVNNEQSDQVNQKKPAIDTAMVGGEHAGHGVKRKATGDESVAKHPKLDESFIISEENRRRQERDERSLFIKGFPKKTKTKELEDLHPDIESVRHRKGSAFAWIVFRNEASCSKAHNFFSTTKVGGKQLTVDFCGSKSSKKPHKPKEMLPVNPLELYINGIAPEVTKDDIKNVFRAAVSIHIPSARLHEIRRAFVLFSSEDDAKAAFDKSRGLKLGGRSVEVFYARVRQNIKTPTVKPNTPTTVKPSTPTVKPKKELNTKTAHASTKLTAPKVVENESDSDDDEMPSSDEGIEEVNEQKPRNVTVNKGKLEPQSDDEEEEEEDEDEEEDGDDDDDDDDDEVDEEEEEDEDDEE